MFIAALFVVARTWKQPRCPWTDEWVKWCVCVYIYIYTHIQWNITQPWKEWIWVSWTEVDKPRACFTEWSKSEREKQIWYINAYILNLENWWWWTYLQAGIETQTSRTDLWTQQGKERVGQTERAALTYIHYYVENRQQVGSRCITQGAQSGDLWQPRGVGWGGGQEGGSRRRGHMYTCGWFTLLHGRNQNNIVKQLSSN